MTSYILKQLSSSTCSQEPSRQGSRLVLLQALGAPAPQASLDESIHGLSSLFQNHGCLKPASVQQGGGPRKTPASGSQPCPHSPPHKAGLQRLGPGALNLQDSGRQPSSPILGAIQKMKPLKTWPPIMQISKMGRENAFSLQRPNGSNTEFKPLYCIILLMRNTSVVYVSSTSQ